MDDIKFGQYIVQLRTAKNISQRKLAEKARLTNSTISRIEANLVKPDPATIEKIAYALEEDKSMMMTKCGYSEIPEEFVVLARKTGELTKQQQEDIFRIFNDTIDGFLLDDDEEE